MEGLFYDCSGLTSLDLSGLDTRNVTEMGEMFSGCSVLTVLHTPMLMGDSFTTELPAKYYDADAYKNGGEYKETKVLTAEFANVALQKVVGSEEPAPTGIPIEPAPTKEPVPTEAPSPTEEPAPTDAPVPTEEPLPTEAPHPTEQPSPTDPPAHMV